MLAVSAQAAAIWVVVALESRARKRVTRSKGSDDGLADGKAGSDTIRKDGAGSIDGAAAVTVWIWICVWTSVWI
jgi:hypothetical protein